MQSAPSPSTERPRPSGCTNLRLHQLVRRVDQFYDAAMAACGLRTSQYSLLSFVVRRGPLSPGELARGLRLQPSTLSRNLRPLVACGWVVLGPGADGRSRSVQATADGRAKREEAFVQWKRVQRELNARLGEARVAALHALADDCLERLGPCAPARRARGS